MPKLLDPKRGKALIGQLVELDEADDDVTPIATAVRHLALHGDLAPATIGYKSGNDAAQLLRALRDETLRASDEHFTQWLNAQLGTTTNAAG